MCLIKDCESPEKEVSPPRSPWAKLLNRQNLKPKLPRKVVTSARVNLNKCWTKLGELMSSSPKPDLQNQEVAQDEEPILIAFPDFFFPNEPVKPLTTEDDDNAENQNILNGHRFELVAEDDQETNENLANEVREICYSAIKLNCALCNLCK